MAVRVQVPPSAPTVKKAPKWGPFLLLDRRCYPQMCNRGCLIVYLNMGFASPQRVPVSHVQRAFCRLMILPLAVMCCSSNTMLTVHLSSRVLN